MSSEVSCVHDFLKGHTSQAGWQVELAILIILRFVYSFVRFNKK